MKYALQYHALKNPRALIRRIEQRLDGDGIAASWIDAEVKDGTKGSAVLLLLTQSRTGPAATLEPCLLLNKRSRQVLQPGDLCCPGGGVGNGDKFWSLFLHLPYSPLHKWSRWPWWRVRHPRIAGRISLLMTTGLREAWEEMRLNPMLVSFLGPLPVQKLVLFDRRIYPLAAWMPACAKLKPNWEVDRIVHIPLRKLLNRQNYGRYRLTFKAGNEDVRRMNDFPCFIHHGRQGTDILWGATFRIVMDFLDRVFGFQVPDMQDLKVIKGKRGTTYLNGSLWTKRAALQEEHEEDY